jgi:iron complex transport system substrate-binding protein
MKLNQSFIFFLILLTILPGCTNNKKDNSGKGKKSVIASKNVVRYAQGFSLDRFADYTSITVFNPWKQGDTLATYVLIRNRKNISKIPKSGNFRISIPVKKVASLSSTFLGMFSLLGETDKISGCTDPNLINDSLLYHRFLNGTLINLGESVQPNTEAIVNHNPDLLMKYIYGVKDPFDEKIISAGIPIAYNLEFMETHPLGRSEWIKFVAAFLDDDAKADSIFDSIEQSYLYLSKLATNRGSRPTVLDGSSYKGVWYAAGGKSFPAKLYADAGACYYWQNDSNRGSVPRSFEQIIDKQANCDYWIGPSTGSKEELLSIESRFQLLKPFRTGKVYHFGKRVNPNGGLDYYESGVIHPDILLKDLIYVFHPELLPPDYEPVYLQKVK